MPDRPSLSGEAAIIQTYFAPLAAGYPGAFGLGDDCAAVRVPDGHEMIVSTDPLIEGVHFLAGDDPSAVAWRAVAVNVSDVVAKGGEPIAYLVALALPSTVTLEWIAGFARGLDGAQRRFRCRLAGGDLDRTPGLLSISVTMIGSLPRGGFVSRAGARAGDIVYVSGAIGDAGLGLALRLDGERWGIANDARSRLVERSIRPTPPLDLVAALQQFASASIDVSDGLAKDFNTLCQMSNAGGRLDACRVPVSDDARRLLDRGLIEIGSLLTSGDDYEVLATLPPNVAEPFERAAVAAGVAVTAIGIIEPPEAGVRVDIGGRALEIGRAAGWDHFP